MESFRRLIRFCGRISGARWDATWSRGWEPYASQTLFRREETGWLCLLVVLCFAAVLDMHASARRESQLRPVLPATVDWRRAEWPRVEAQPAQAPAGKRLRAYSKAEVQRLIRVHAGAHGLDPELPLAIAECESGFRWDAASRRSSARGVFQYLSGTWRSTREGRRGTSVLDTDAHIRMAVAHIATSGTGPWNASRRCWSALTAPQDAEETPSQEADETSSQGIEETPSQETGDGSQPS
jgi:hypothetical protein